MTRGTIRIDHSPLRGLWGSIYERLMARPQGGQAFRTIVAVKAPARMGPRSVTAV
jgi:hypothetical protein